MTTDTVLVSAHTAAGSQGWWLGGAGRAGETSPSSLQWADLTPLAPLGGPLPLAAQDNSTRRPGQALHDTISPFLPLGSGQTTA